MLQPRTTKVSKLTIMGLPDNAIMTLNINNMNEETAKYLVDTKWNFLNHNQIVELAKIFKIDRAINSLFGGKDPKDLEVIARIGRDQDLDRLRAHFEHENVRKAVANHKREKDFQIFLNDSNKSIAQYFIVEYSRRLLEKNGPFNRTEYIVIPQELEKFKHVFDKMPKPEIVKSIASNNDATILEAFSRHPDSDYRSVIALRGLHFDKLVHDSSPSVRAVVARKCEEEYLDILVKDESYAVRLAVANRKIKKYAEILQGDLYYDIRDISEDCIADAEKPEPVAKEEVKPVAKPAPKEEASSGGLLKGLFKKK